MPISYRIDTEKRMVLTKASGTLTDEDVLALKARLTRDPDFVPGMRELSDCRGIERLAVTSAGVRAMVQQDQQQARAGGPHKLALVLSRDVAFGMARMYQSLAESNEQNHVGVFRDIDEARAWLESA